MIPNQTDGFKKTDSVFEKHNKFNTLTLIFVFLIFFFGVFIFWIVTLKKNFPKRNIVQTTDVSQATISPNASPKIHNPSFIPISLSSLKGKLIYQFEGDLWVSDINGSQKIKLVEGNDFDSSISFKRWSNEKKTLYFTAKKIDDYALYGKNLLSGKTTLLFILPTIFDLDLSVSPDGKYLLYPDEGNIFLYDLENKTNKKILTHRECLEDKQTGMFRKEDYDANGLPNCYDYKKTIWSKSGTKAIVKKNGYAYSMNVLINPFNPIPYIKELWGGSILYWSNDDKRIIIGGMSYDDGAGKIYLFPNINNPSIKIELLYQPHYTFINNWLVSNDGNMIFSTYYKQDNAGFPTDKIGAVLYSVQNDTIKPIPNFDLTDFILHFWLPDNRTILMENYETNILWTYDTLNSFKQKLPIKTDGSREIWLAESL